MSFQYPTFLNIQSQPCLVLGAGIVGTPKILALVKAGAKVTVIAPQASDQVRALSSMNAIDWHCEEFSNQSLEDYFLVIAATSDAALNRRVSMERRERGGLVNVVDDPEACNFIVPSIARRSSLTVAVSSNGQSPTLAARLRRIIERDVLTEDMGLLVDFLSLKRAQVRVLPWPYREKKSFWSSVVDSDIPSLLSLGKEFEAEQRFSELFQQAEQTHLNAVK